MVFSKGTAANRGKFNMTYNPQGLKIFGKKCKNNTRKFGTIAGVRPSNANYENYVREFTNYPSDVLFYDSPITTKRLHTNQKPVDLLEYLIKTYTNEGELVLDNCIGSGSTAVACVNTGRNFIGFETEKKYFDMACKRIEDACMSKEIKLL